jgi:hypothetical protein
MTFTIDTGPSAFSAPAPAPSAESGFAKHGIGHLSASSINLWINAPDVWVTRYLHGRKGTFGAAPRRGQLAEDIVATCLAGGSFDDASKAALAAFDAEFPGEDKERANIPAMAEIALTELQQYGAPHFEGEGQNRIEIAADFGAWSIPVIGYLDFDFPDHGLVIDLKTTARVPSQMSPEHQLQRAIYSAAKGNAAVKFLYVSTKKTALLEDGDPREVLAKAKLQIARLNRFLLATDKNTALDIVPHNPSSFYWRGDEAARHEIFGS